MSEQSLPFHEAFELHEVLNFKTLCMVKSKLMEGLVFNQDLKALLEKDVKQSQRRLNKTRKEHAL